MWNVMELIGHSLGFLKPTSSNLEPTSCQNAKLIQYQKIKIDLIKELESAYRQLKFYKNNCASEKYYTIPKALKDRITYLQAYTDCILKLDRMKKTDEDLKLAKRLQSIYGGTFDALY